MIITLDTLALLAALTALIILLSRWKRFTGPDVRKILLPLLILLTGNMALFWIEWSGLSHAYEGYEDFLGALIPMLWAFLFYAYIQKGMNQELRESKERLRITLNSIGDGMMATDCEGRIMHMNPPAEQITGWSFEEARNKSLSTITEFTNAETGETIKNPVTQVLETGRVIQLADHTKITSKEGSEHYIDDSAAPIRDDAGNLIGVVLVFRDKTEEYQLRQQIEQNEEQIRRSQKLEALGKLAGGVAHDLNNLLTPILGYSELMADDTNLHEAQSQSLTTINRAGERARDLVRQLLAFSRKQTLEFKSINLNDIIVNFEKLLLRTIPEDIQIDLQLTANLPAITADTGQVEQIIMNLAVNAADAMPNGGRLIIETAQTDLDQSYAEHHPDVTPGPYVMLGVSDTGCGMDSETLEHAYDPFFSTKGDKGTGLGLATVFGIVKQHNGNIWLYSEPDKGTTFKIYLPVSTEHVPEPTTPSDQLITENFMGSETILLVEDNDLVRQLTYSILERFGYDILVAEDANSALQILENTKRSIDLLLTDIIMPGLNGRKLYEMAAQKKPGIKVLYMSGYSENIISYRGILYKNVNFIQKPFSAKTIGRKIRTVLET